MLVRNWHTRLQGDERPEPQDAVEWLRSKGVTLAALTLIAIQVVWLAVLLARSYFRQDDYFNFDRALTNGLTWTYLMRVNAGHMAPLGFAMSWLLARVSLYNWTLTCVVILALVAAAGLALLRVLRTNPGGVNDLVQHLIAKAPHAKRGIAAISRNPCQDLVMQLLSHGRIGVVGRRIQIEGHDNADSVALGSIQQDIVKLGRVPAEHRVHAHGLHFGHVLVDSGRAVRRTELLGILRVQAHPLDHLGLAIHQVLIVQIRTNHLNATGAVSNGLAGLWLTEPAVERANVGTRSELQ